MPTSIRRMAHRIAVLAAALVGMGGLCLVAAPQSNAAEPTAAAQPHTAPQTEAMATYPLCAGSLTWRCVVLPRATTQALADAPLSEVAGVASSACGFIGHPAGVAACTALVNGSAGAVSYTSKQAIKKNECFALVYDPSGTILLRPTTQPCRA
ncbi:hypothetical protein GCM10010304_80240 [Streptomyces roseoviolaceus]